MSTPTGDAGGVVDTGSLTVFPDLVQGTDAWLDARCGLLTASVVGKLVTPTLKVADNDVSRGVTATLVSERITGWSESGPMTSDMYRGVVAEPIARDAYAEHFAPVEEIGFMVRDFGGVPIGYSPDGLVGESGVIEIKAPRAKTHVLTILADKVPAHYMAQCQTALLVSGRDWCDFVSYSGGLPLWTKRVHPDPAWHDVILAAAQQFEANAADLLSRYAAAVHGLPTTERLPDFDLEPVI